jgi:hypothetical protein
MPSRSPSGLRELEERRHRHDGRVGRKPEGALRVGAEGGEHEGRELLGALLEVRRRKREAPAGAHESLELGAGVVGVFVEESSGARAHGDFAARIDPDHAREERPSVGRTHRRRAVSADEDRDGVGRTEIDAEELFGAHAESPPESARASNGARGEGTVSFSSLPSLPGVP